MYLALQKGSGFRSGEVAATFDDIAARGYVMRHLVMDFVRSNWRLVMDR